MATKVVDSLEAVKADVFKEISARMDGIARDITEEIQVHYESFIDRWYSAYTPEYYNRTYDTFYGSNAADGVDGVYSVSSSGDGFNIIAGIVVSPLGLHGYYKDPVDYVFERSWVHGIHGTIGTGGQSTYPKILMDKWFNSFKNTIYSFVRSRL